jgi:energy-coupling factor transporter ATP-binding protein EcfA2
VSLLRSVTPATVRGQFHRIARGGARLSRYEFSYTAPKPPRSRAEPVTLSFEVEPESQPPTNIHVLIGRNGVGKTHLLNHMARALVQESAKAAVVGAFTGGTEDIPEGHLFANLVSVTFSAFDPFEPLPIRQDKSEGVQYAYIGLKRRGKTAKRQAFGAQEPRSALERVREERVDLPAGRPRKPVAPRP